MMAKGLIIIFPIFILVASADVTKQPIAGKRCNLIVEVSSRNKTITLLRKRGVDLIKITTLVIENQKMNFMPVNLENIFPNIEFLLISNSQLKEVLSTDIAPFKKLKKLHIVGNEIQEIKADLFDHNKIIEDIDLSNNKIGLIESNAFDSLSNLTKIDLRDNICINESFELNDVKNEVKKSIENKCNGVALVLRKEMEIMTEKLNKNITLLRDLLTNKQTKDQEVRIVSLNGESNTIIIFIVFMLLIMIFAVIFGTVYYVKKSNDKYRLAFNRNINLQEKEFKF